MISQEIESIIIGCLTENLSFKNEEFIAFWNIALCKWQSNSNPDALSCVLIKLNPEPNRNGDDDIVVATLSKLFGISAGWIRSFQDGWRGISNRHTSITGYLLGRKLRLRYLCTT